MTKSCVPRGVKNLPEHRSFEIRAKGLRHRKKSYALRDLRPVETPVAQSLAYGLATLDHEIPMSRPTTHNNALLITIPKIFGENS